MSNSSRRLLWSYIEKFKVAQAASVRASVGTAPYTARQIEQQLHEEVQRLEDVLVDLIDTAQEIAWPPPMELADYNTTEHCYHCKKSMGHEEDCAWRKFVRAVEKVEALQGKFE